MQANDDSDLCEFFGYVSTAGRSDLAASFDAVPDLEHLREEEIRRLTGWNIPDFLENQNAFDECVTSSNPDARIGILCAVKHAPEILDRFNADTMHEMMFKDADAVVRGLSLRVIATAHR